MSEQTKKTVKQAEEFFKQVEQGAQEFSQSIPDIGLQKKIQKVSEGAGEVVKHIKERTDH